MKLPYLKEIGGRLQSEAVTLRGINFSDCIQDGDLRDCMNLSARRYPYIAPRRARVKQEGVSYGTGLMAWGKLIVVDGSTLLCDGEIVGQVTPGVKQFAVVNTKLCIWPDRAYLDLTNNKFGYLDASVSAMQTEEYPDTTTFFYKNAIELPSSFTTSYLSRVGEYDQKKRIAVNHVVKRYTSASWSESEGWTLEGEEEVNVCGVAATMTEERALVSGDIVMFVATDTSGNYVVDSKMVQLDKNTDKKTVVSDYVGAAHNREGYFGIVDSVEWESLSSPGHTVYHYLWKVRVVHADQQSQDLTNIFSVGDLVTVSGCETVAENNTEEGKFLVITGFDQNKIIFSGDVFTGVPTGETRFAEKGKVTVRRPLPDMDFICASENRLWGCSNKEQTIYVSALGKPTAFYDKEGVSTDSYAVAVASDGDFTGCAAYSNSVLFWKEAKLHKMLGSTPKEYAMYTYNLEGLKAGCHKSQQIINEVLYYAGLHGIYAYTGGTPTLISSCFGNRRFTDAVAGTDGDSYYLSALDENGTAHLLVYETQNGLWLHEDNTRVIDFARVGKDLYFLDEQGGVWLADGRTEDPDVEWMAQFTPFYETLGGRKAYSKLILRLELPRGSFLAADIRFDSGVWKECSKVVGEEHDAVTLRIPVNRCDKFEIRLRGKGPCTVLSVLREFTVGSDV